MKVLFNRTDAIGDMLLTMPMVRLLKEKHKACQVGLVVSPRAADLLEQHPTIDRYWVIDPLDSNISNFIRLWRIFSEFRPDAYFHVGGVHTPSWVAWFKRIPFRGGLKSKWPSFITLNQGVRQSRSLVTMHESDYNMSLLAPLNIEWSEDQRKNFSPQIHLGEDEKLKALGDFKGELAMRGLQPGLPFIIVHPGMSGHTLNWASRNYGRLIERLERTFPGQFNYMVSYTPSDEKYLQGIREHLAGADAAKKRENVIFIDGSIKGLRQYMALMSQAALFIGPSTGTTHIANCLGIKHVGLYSPIKVQSALRWGPFCRDSDQVGIVTPDVVCGEQFHCTGQECPYYECMAKIEVDDVLKVAARLLGKNT